VLLSWRVVDFYVAPYLRRSLVSIFCQTKNTLPPHAWGSMVKSRRADNGTA